MDAYISSNPKLKNTYELETQPYKTNYIPYNSNEELTHRTAQERLSQSPPIILCETSDFRNSRTHRHRYLFYPSASRLSPYSDLHTFSNFNIATGSDPRKDITNSNFDLEKEVDKLRERNRQIKEEYNKRHNELNDDNYGNRKGINRPESANYNTRRGKYKDLLEKSNDLKNSIENLIKEEEGKKRGPLGYYNNRNSRDNRDNEFDEIINRQINLFDTKKSNRNLNNNINNNRDSKYNSQFNRNNDSENYNLNNNDYNDDQFKSGTLRDRDGSESNYFNKNKNYTNSNNFNSKLNNFNNEQDYNNGNNRKYMRTNKPGREEDYNDNKFIPSKNGDLTNNEEYNDKNDIYSKNGNRKNNEEDYNDHKDIFSKNKDEDYNDQKDIYSKNKNRIHNEGDYNDHKDIFSKEGNENNDNEDYNDHKDIYSKTNNPDYIGNNDIFSSKNNYRTYNNNKSNNNIENNNDNNIYSNDINNSNNINNEINSENNKRSTKGYNIYQNNNNDEDEKIINSGNNINNTGKQNRKDIESIDGIATLPETMLIGNRFIMNKNTDSLMGNNNNYISNSQGNNNNINKSSQGYNSNNVLRNTNNPNDINNINKNNKYINIMDSVDNNIISKDGESSGKLIKLVLADENNMEILSENREPFIGEEIQDKKVIEGNKVLVVTKGGENVALNVLRNYEGEILADENGNAILGRDNIYFFDKNGGLVVSTDKKLLEGDKAVPAKVKKVKFNPSVLSGTFNSNGDNNLFNSIPLTKSFGMNNIRGNTYGDNYELGTSQMRRKHNKGRWKMFPKGDGDAKPPIIKKKKRKIKKK